ncbi:DoxX family protein [Adhaeribacter soli]|uniref:DoxX family protein n=1 Tax=Adhaeribacter soli TaxID=2607655 RepID=A0A5N1ILC4_9BACT|nr:DoxX family protein [Adhaeribacter soli]KAA9326006.1 DoxX family protein [Adhaeribacter soli]
MKFLRNYYPNRDLGLLILRILLGIMFMLHGWPKIAGGTEKWTAIGGSMSSFGIEFMPGFWGFMAAFTEFFGGFLFIIGLFFRPVNLLLLLTMIVATAKHASAGDGFIGYSHALEAGILFFSLLFIGPGRYSLDAKYFPGERLR